MTLLVANIRHYGFGACAQSPRSARTISESWSHIRCRSEVEPVAHNVSDVATDQVSVMHDNSQKSFRILQYAQVFQGVAIYNKEVCLC